MGIGYGGKEPARRAEAPDMVPGVSLLTMTGAAGQVVTAILTVLIMFGVTARLTMLITEDTITAPLRTLVMRRLGGPQSLAYEWIRCPWCVGLWIATAVTLAVWAGERTLLDTPLLPIPGWLWVPGLALTNNHLAARWQS